MELVTSLGVNKVKKYSLRLKLSLSYILVALVCVGLISILTNFLLDKQFREYVKQNQEQRSKDIVASLTHEYKTYESWNNKVIESIGVSVLEEGYIIKVKDANGSILWDATIHNNGACQRIIQKMADNMNSRYPSFKGGYLEKNYSLDYNLHKIGSVDIGYYGPFYLNDKDLAFINSLNVLFLGAGIFSLLFALVIGIIMARRLSTPISRVVNSVHWISKGYFNDRVTESSTTKEISELSHSVNGLAQTLENQESLRKRLTADVAHELRTPLSTLQGHLEAMIDGIWEPNNERLKSCHEEILRLNRMVGDLEKLTKFESENLILSKTKFDISELIKRILRNFEKDFILKEITSKFIENEQNIVADKDKISQVIINLISNALKYTPKGGNIGVSIERIDNNIRITVKDNGIGIPKEDLPNVFERFYRADKSRNRQTGGSGIGLTIVKAIVQAHNGSINIKSEVDVGTEVIVTLQGDSSL